MLLEVRDLKAYFNTLSGQVKAVDGISFDVEKGKATGLAGESGCGKTTTALALLRILPPAGRILGGQVLLDGKDILKLSEDEVREDIRWKQISIVFQGAMNALNPVISVGDQIVEAIRLHDHDATRTEAWERAGKLLELVGIDASRLSNFAHEFSGGMRQRSMIAMALACNPSLLIADEPATALDVVVAAQVLKLLKELKAKLDLGMILITHDLSIIAEVCERVAIMYAGKIAEYADAVTTFQKPWHPYTQGLIAAFPNIRGERMRMVSIPGIIPDLLKPPPACRFHPRCQYAKAICKTEEPQFLELEVGHFVSCHKAEAESKGKEW